MSNTREQILEAASRLIHLRGFNNTSVEDILRECGIGKGNFYYYFKSKDELGFAALERTLEGIRRELGEQCFTPGRDPWEQLQAFIDRPVAHSHKHGCAGGCPLGNLAVEMSDIHEGFRQRLHAAFADLGARVEACLRQARAEGSLREETDIPRLARFLLASLEGAFLMGKLHQDPHVLAGILDELKEHLDHYRAAPALGAAR